MVVRYDKRRRRTSERDFKQAYARIIGKLPDSAPISIAEMGRLPGVNTGLLRELARMEARQIEVVVKAAMKNEAPQWGRGGRRPSKPWALRDAQGRYVPVAPEIRGAIKGPFDRLYAETRAGALSRAGLRVSAEPRARGRYVFRVEPAGARPFIANARDPRSVIDDRVAMSHRRAAAQAARRGDAAAASDHKRQATNAARRAATARKAGK